MNTRRNEAYKLRVQGKSYSEICGALQIPKSTLSSWFKDLALSDKARRRLQSRLRQGMQNGLVRRNKYQTIEARRRAKFNRDIGTSQISKLTEYEIILVGTALYWAEGFKRLQSRGGRVRTVHPIRMVNTDPVMIRLFINFLQTALNVEPTEISLTMRIYDHINTERALRYWTEITGLPKNNFRKTTRLVSRASKGTRPFNRLPWGALEIEVCRTDKFHHLMGWIEGMKKAL